ncbi:xylose isomerase [Bacteroidia bacterium]|nr:xylose isomerase [Bacteroidia bacterium]
MISRRTLLKGIGAASAGLALPACSAKATDRKTAIRYCLNTSTISEGTGMVDRIEIAAKAGYDGVELWVSDVQQYIAEGNSTASLKKLLDERHLKVENAIGFAQWIVDDYDTRKAGFEQMESEMRMLAETGCTRVAAPPAGAYSGELLNLDVIAQRYRELIELGLKTGVMPQLEIWGAAANMSRLAQALYVASAANHPQARVLADVFHLYRGRSDFDGLNVLSGNACDIFHINDYPFADAPEQLSDSDRVFPGAGVAPYDKIAAWVHQLGGEIVLSLELFNHEYWKRAPLEVASEGLNRMKKIFE